jgi:hypothetical protein
VTANGVQLKPALALGSWAAFKRTGAGGEAMAMGDLALIEDEVGPVMLALQQGGVEQTALHNHVLHESPRVMYMHIAAHGDRSHMLEERPRLFFMHLWANDDAVTLAHGLPAALDKTS